MQRFVQWYRKSRSNPNLTKLVTTTMPKGRGHKGSIAPPKKKKKVTSASVTRVPFSAVCNSSKQQDEIVCTPDVDFDDCTVSEDHRDRTSIGHEKTSGVGCASNSKSSDESLVHTITLAKGSSSQAYARSVFFSHSISLPRQASSIGFVSTTSAMLSVPPPLILNGQASSTGLRVLLMLCPQFLHLSFHVTPVLQTILLIRCYSFPATFMCRGCRQRFVKPPLPPDDLCVRHQEWQEFTPVGGSCLQHRYGNVYYHCNLPCILARCANFSPSDLEIPISVLVRLLPIHTAFIQKHMPGRI